ncbi:MAG: hypothetical protein ABJ387_00525 [Balneola sp.]
MLSIKEKIELNKITYDKLHSELKSLSTFNNVYFIYLGFIGAYFFQIVSHILSIDYNSLSNIDLTIYLFFSFAFVLVLFSLTNFLNLIIPRYSAYDLLPKEYYSELYEDIHFWIKDNSLSRDAKHETKEEYLLTLERANEINFELIKAKKDYRYFSLIFALLSLLPYLITIIIYSVNHE